MRSLQTAFFPSWEHTGVAIAQGLREVLAWLVQEEKIVCINGLDISLSNIVAGRFPYCFSKTSALDIGEARYIFCLTINVYFNAFLEHNLSYSVRYMLSTVYIKGICLALTLIYQPVSTCWWMARWDFWCRCPIPFSYVVYSYAWGATGQIGWTHTPTCSSKNSFSTTSHLREKVKTCS